MTLVLDDLEKTAVAAGVARPPGAIEIRDWLLRTLEFFREERARFGEAPDWDCLFQDWGDPGMYVVAQVGPALIALTAGRVDAAKQPQFRRLIDDWPASESARLLQKIAGLVGAPFWRKDLPLDSLQ